MQVVNVDSNGKAPKGLTVGDIVNTAGGLFKISGFKQDGSYNSEKVSSVKVNPDGKAPKGLPTGTVVDTNGGRYLITNVEKNGSYASGKILDPVPVKANTASMEDGIHYVPTTSGMTQAWYKVQNGKVVDKSFGFRMLDLMGQGYDFGSMEDVSNKPYTETGVEVPKTTNEMQWFTDLVDGGGRFLTSANSSEFNLNTIIGVVVIAFIAKILFIK